ncbi:alpha/beta fold hydrolase [Ilumatobacter sp.]|uniref:alpha/beta fold hydrolase n=1 Tax=Ilumatobacter sp. TaxID=1967498 RepID=UPI003B52D9DB
MQIRNDDVSLHVAVDGPDDAPPILLIHGILGCGRTWEWIVPRLSDRHRLLRLDLRGHGRSDRAPDRYQLADYVSDARAACEQVAGAPCVVIGHSLGGATAAGLAQSHPDLVRGVVLEDPPLSVPDPTAEGAARNSLMDVFGVLRTVIPEVQESGASVDQVAGSTAMAPSAAGPPLGEILHDDAILTTAAGTLAVDASVLDHVLAGTSTPVFDPSRPLPVPAMVVAADPSSPDAVTRPTDIPRLAEVSPHVEARTLTGANHLIHDSVGQREPFFAIVEEFLASLD